MVTDQNICSLQFLPVRAVVSFPARPRAIAVFTPHCSEKGEGTTRRANKLYPPCLLREG